MSLMIEDQPDAWLVPWFRANGDSGTSVYVKKEDAERAAENLQKYSSSETTADVIPLYARLPAADETIKLPGHDETTAGLNSLTIRRP